MRRKLLVIFNVFMLLGGLVIGKSKLPEFFNKFSTEQKIRLLKDIVKREPFLTYGADIRLKKFTIGKFFNMRIYKKLEGNDILGYNFDEGFKFDRESIHIKTVRTNDKTGKYRKAFIRSLIGAVGSHKIKISKSSSIEIGISLLDVEKKRTPHTLPGALVEVYFKNKKSGKHFYYRFGTGNQLGIKKAFEDIWLLIFSVLESLK